MIEMSSSDELADSQVGELLGRTARAIQLETELARLETDAADYSARAATNERALNELKFGKGGPNDPTHVCLGSYFVEVSKSKAELLLRRNQAELREKQAATRAAMKLKRDELEHIVVKLCTEV